MTVITDAEITGLLSDINTVDDVVESPQPTTISKLGTTIRTLSGMNADADVVINDISNRGNAAISDIETRGDAAIDDFSTESSAQLLSQESTFQNRFAFSQPSIAWTALTLISDELQLYTTGIVGDPGYSVWLADPAQLPFTTSATFAEDDALNRWQDDTNATKAWSQSSEVDASLNLVTAESTTTPRSLGERSGEVSNVMDFAATGLGIADEFIPFSLALANAITKQIPVYIPSGKYYMPNNQSLQATTCDTLVIYGDGDLSEILYDDYVNPATFTPLLLGDVTETIGRLEMYNFKVHGKWSEEIDFTENSTMVYFWHVLSLWVNNVTLEGSRGALLLVEDCKVAQVTGSRFKNSYRDGCRLMETETATVTGNSFKGIQDDSIAVSTRDTDRVYNDSSTVITHNMLEDSQGITALGAKKIVIDDNIIARPMSLGIRVGQSTGFETGHTSITSLSIANNVISDIFRGTLFSPSSSNEQFGIQVTSLPMLAKDTVGTWDGANVIRPYENLYVFDSNDALEVNAGNWNMMIDSNHVVRTLPPVANYSDYGYGQRLSRSGFVDPAVADSDLWHDGITINGSAYNLRIGGNTIMGATSCIYFDTTGLSPSFLATTWRNVNVCGNTLKDFREAGVKGSGTGYIKVMSNDINGDPYLTMPLRNGTDGSWLGTFAQHAGILQDTTLCVFEADDNDFRNVGIPVQSNGSPTIWGKNTQYCDPFATGYNIANKGIGFVHNPAIAGAMVIEQCDPTVADFGRVINVTAEATTTGSPPNSGTYVEGQFVRNANKTLQISGWNRGTTGNGHTAGGIGSDWIVIWGTP